MRTAQNVSIPNGLIEELMQWAEDEMEQSVHNTQHRTDIGILYDRLAAAKNEMS